jgi:AraC-like DNA-binding protein
VALDCGYYDQAHMIRDFRELAEISPARYMRQQGR